jgi:hypothetical protein
MRWTGIEGLPEGVVMDEQKFDASRPIRLFLSPDKTRSVFIRYPSDAEWTALQCGHRSISKPHGRDGFHPKPSRQESGPAIVALANALRIEGEGAIEIDAQEAKCILNTLLKCEVTGIQPVRDGFRIETDVMGGRHTAHTLRRPECAEILQYQSSYRSVVRLPHGQVETTVHLEAFGALYGALLQSTEGYAAAPPIVHQRCVIDALLEEIARIGNSPKSQESARAENAQPQAKET